MDTKKSKQTKGTLRPRKCNTRNYLNSALRKKTRTTVKQKVFPETWRRKVSLETNN